MHSWTTQPCRPGRYNNRDQSNRAAHQPRSAQRDRLDADRQSKIHPAQSYVNKHQSEGPSRRHNRVDMSGRSLRSVKRKDICDPRISTATARTNSFRHSRARDFGKAKVQQAQPHINPEQQSENAAGRHSRVDQSGVTTVSSAKAYLAQPYIHGDQRSESTFGPGGYDVCMSPWQHNQSATRKQN